MKRPSYFFLLFTVFFGVIVALSFKELKQTKESIEAANGLFLVFAGAFEMLYYTFQSEVRRSLYKIQQIHEPFWRMLKLNFAGMFIGTVIPSFHIASLTLFLKEAKARQYSQSKALIGNVAFLFFDFISFMIVLFLSLGFLMRSGSVNNYEIFASILLLLMMLVTTSIIVWGLKDKSRLVLLFTKVKRVLPKQKKGKVASQKGN